MAENLQTKTIHSVFWAACERGGALFVQFCVTLVLARILAPSDYGLLGMLTVFTAIGTVLIDSGFSQALIRKVNINSHDYPTVFYTNIVLGGIIYGLLFLIAPYIAIFYNEPQLEGLSKVLFLMFPICALGIVQETILLRTLRFKLIASIAITAAFISGCVGIIMALHGYGVWALVYQQLTLYIARVLGFWLVSGWKPRWLFDFGVLKELSGFSLNLLLISFINNIFNNIYTLVIGKYFTTSETGYYNQARLLAETPATLIAGVVHRATYPILSQIQENDKCLKVGYKKIISMTMFINLPVLLGMLAIADNLFIVLFSEKWLPAVPVFQVLCVYGAIYPLHVINTNLLRVKGKGRLFLLLEITKKVFMVLAIVLTLQYGIIPLIWGSVFASIMATFLNMYFCGKLIDYSILEQVWDISKILIVAIVMMVAVWMVGYIPLNIYILFSLQIVVGILIYIGIAYIVGIDSLKKYKSIFQNKVHEKIN
ncbi:lipopolysaccharide biosynthesis protein [Butyricimonas sp.]|uniref:lipopolysaccharide biosynthesis protein n=1 Tax=Butyricimonas sp. TaxID=1969738 RepID=UPI0025BF654B|nr:lipopolysaccharide biosynthesis protein [Butyricimonas sp.]